MPIVLPEGITVLPVPGRECSIAYLVRYQGKEVGKIERVLGVRGGGWRYFGQGLLCYVKGDAVDLRSALDFLLHAVELVIKRPPQRKKAGS